VSTPDPDQAEPPLDAAEAARLVRRRRRRRGLQQCRTIFRSASYWGMATLFLALLGSVFHFFEVKQSCADILGVDGPVHARIAMEPPGVVVVCETGTAPARSVDIPMATTALVILWAALGVAASIAFLLGYRQVSNRIDRGEIEL
jgi:hypothetical protein